MTWEQLDEAHGHLDDSRMTRLALALMLAGCARLSTERARYADADVIHVRLENRAPQKILYWPCYPYLERRVGDHWVHAHWVDADERMRRNPLSHDCVLRSYKLLPHTQVSWSVLVAPGSPSGTYRFMVPLVRGRELTSKPFEYR